MFDRLYALIAKTKQLPVLRFQLADAKRAYVRRHLARKGVRGLPTKEYSPRWARVRAKRGLQAERHDYHFTGALHDTLILRKEETGVVMEAVEYAKYLQERFPEHFSFGHSDDLRAAANDIQKEVLAWLR